jgi:hypothetical protein
MEQIVHSANVLSQTLSSWACAAPPKATAKPQTMAIHERIATPSFINKPPNIPDAQA